MRRNDDVQVKHQQLLADLQREKERHQARLDWARAEILLSRARQDPWGYSDGEYRNLSDVSDSEAELWLRRIDEQHRI